MDTALEETRVPDEVSAHEDGSLVAAGCLNNTLVTPENILRALREVPRDGWVTHVRLCRKLRELDETITQREMTEATFGKLTPTHQVTMSHYCLIGRYVPDKVLENIPYRIFSMYQFAQALRNVDSPLREEVAVRYCEAVKRRRLSTWDKRVFEGVLQEVIYEQRKKAKSEVLLEVSAVEPVPGKSVVELESPPQSLPTPPLPESGNDAGQVNVLLRQLSEHTVAVEQLLHRVLAELDTVHRERDQLRAKLAIEQEERKQQLEQLMKKFEPLVKVGKVFEGLIRLADLSQVSPTSEN